MRARGYAGVFAGAALLAAGSFLATRSEAVIPSGPPVQVTLTPPAGGMRSPGGPAESFGDGIHEVISEVKPGVYRTSGSWIEGVPLCSWRLHKADHLIASGTATGPVSIVVLEVYDAVESQGCQQWRRVGDAS